MKEKEDLYNEGRRRSYGREKEELLKGEEGVNEGRRRS